MSGQPREKDSRRAVVRSPLIGQRPDHQGRRNPANTPAQADSTGQKSLALVDQFAFSRECTVRALQSARPGTEILAFESPDALIGGVEIPASFGLVLFNGYGLGSDGPEIALMIAGLRDKFAGVPVVLIDDPESEDDVIQALRLGLRGYIPRNVPLDVVMQAIRLVEAGGTFIPAASLLQAPRPPRLANAGANGSGAVRDLTAAQLKILRRVSEGKPNKVIARELSISENTVKAHLRSIMGKLKAANRTEVALITRGMSLKDA